MSTKIPAVAEDLGRLAKWHLTGGQVHDVTQSIGLLADIPAGAVLAGKACDDVLEKIKDSGAKAVIPMNCKRTQINV